jgi:hypothetical protein
VAALTAMDAHVAAHGPLGKGGSGSANDTPRSPGLPSDPPAW